MQAWKWKGSWLGVAWGVLLGLLIGQAAYAGLTDLSRRKSYADGEVFYADDVNLDNDHLINAYNLVVVYFPGDSLKVPIVVVDTLIAKSIAKIVVKDPLVSLSASDSLIYHLANIKRLNADSMFVGAATAGYVGGAAAGKRVYWVYAANDTLNTDSLTISGSGKMRALPGATITFVDGSTTDIARAVVDSLRTDSLTLSVNARMRALPGAHVVFTDGSSANFAWGQIDTLNSDSLTANKLTIMSTAVFSAGYSAGATAHMVDYLGHSADANTYVGYPAEDQFKMVIGGEELLFLFEGAQDSVRLGDGGDVDINLNDDLYIEGSTGYGSIGDRTPDAAWDVVGSIFSTGLSVRGTINLTGSTVSDGGAVTTIDINGGTIDGTTVGASTPASGAFTTLSANGNVSLTGNTMTVSATSSFSGGLTANQLKVTGTSQLTGRVTASAGVASTISSTFSGGLTTNQIKVTGPSQLTGRVTASAGLTSTISSTFSGGLTTNSISDDATTETTSGTTGAIHTDGGLGVAKDVYVGDDLLMGSSGSVLNWVSGDVTLTHAAGKLTYGGDGAVELDYNNHEQTNVDINSGAIDGTTIGGAVPGQVWSTALSANGAVRLGDGGDVGTFNFSTITWTSPTTTITNLNADKLDSKSEDEFADLSENETVSGKWTFAAGSTPTFSGGATFNSLNISTATNWKLAGTAYTGSMANINVLVDNSMADALHRHNELSASDGTPDAALALDAQGGYAFTGPQASFSKGVTVGKTLTVKGRTVHGDAVGDSVTFTGQVVTGNPRFYGNIQIDRATALSADIDSAVLILQDTTVTGVSVYRMIDFNLHDPNNLGKFVPAGGGKMKLVSAYDDYRMQERNTSIVRTEGKTYPDWGVKIITAGQDSLVTVDGSTHSRPLIFIGGASNAILDATPVMTSISTQDGRDWVSGTGGADWTLIDWMADGVYQWDTANYSQYKGTLTNRNAGSGWLALATSPAIVNAAVNDGDVTRSPWAIHRDQWGRQLSFWSVGTAGGVSVDSWNGTSTLSIFDSGDTANSILMLDDGSILSIQDDATKDNLHWTYRTQAITADSWTQTETWSNAGTGSEDLRWGNTVIMSDVAAIPGASSAGRNSPRIMLGSDAGVALLDAKAGDNTNSAKAYIDASVSTSLLYGNVHLAFSPASSANLGNIPAIFSTAETAVTRSATPSGPTSHSWAFNGTTSVSRVPDHDSLSFTDNTLSIMGWVYITDTSLGRTIAEKGTEFYLTIGAGENLFLVLYDLSTGGQVGKFSTSPIPTNQWVHLCAISQSGTISLYVNSVSVALADYSSGSFTAIENTSSVLRIGAGFVGTAIGVKFDGPMSPPQIVRGIIPERVIKAEYARGLAAINSPTNDVLTSAAVLRVKAHPDGKYWGVLNASRLEVRDVHGAWIDTFACTQCGTLADFAFAPVPTDSFGVIFGGSTGYRSVIPDVRVEALAQYEWPDHSVIFTSPVVVDSAGNGSFWRVQDALDAISVVSERAVRVLKGTYDDPITSVPAGTLIEGQGIKTLITNANSTGNEPLTISTDSSTVRGIAFRSATGGAGGNQDAILLSGNHNVLVDVTVVDADDDAVAITGRFNRLTDLRVIDADDRGLSFEGGRNSAITPVISSGGSNAVFVAAGDSSRISGGDLSGNIQTVSGATRNIIIGTIYETLLDYGTGTSEAGNP